MAEDDMNLDDQTMMLATAVEAYGHALKVLQDAKVPTIVTAGIAMDLWRRCMAQLTKHGHSMVDCVPQSALWAELVQSTLEELAKQDNSAVH